MVPAPAEDCTTKEDDDCNGVALEGPCICVPGARTACYDGPPATRGVGVCVGGFATCDGSGQALGPCLGEVVPSKEDCSTPADEDCSGPVDCGTSQWSVVGDVGSSAAYRIAVDAQGNVFIAGTTTRTVDLGGGPLVNRGGKDILLAKYDASGHHLWSHVFGDDQDQYAAAVAADPQGNVVLVGTFAGSVDFGDQVLTVDPPMYPPYDNAFLAKFDGDGQIVFSKRFSAGLLSRQEILGVAAGPDGTIAINGGESGGVDFGEGPLPPGSPETGFVATFTPAGAPGWVVSFAGGGSTLLFGAAFDADGDVFVTGAFEGAPTVQGTTLTAVDSQDVVVAKIDGTGTLVWAKGFGGPDVQRGLGIAVTAGGEPVVGVWLSGAMTVGGQTFSSAGGVDVVIAALDGSGDPRWVRHYGDAADQYFESVAVDATGEVVFSALDLGTSDFGRGAPSSINTLPIVKLSGSGAFVWEVTPGGYGGDGIATDAAGDVIAVGSNEHGFKIEEFGR